MPTSLPQISTAIPSHDECEVSLFGPGVGECLVIHYGAGRWFIIDSCLDKETRQPIALVYLRQIGVDLANVHGLLITHWHSDHIDGASVILESCPNAKVFIPASLQSDQALELAHLYQKNEFSQFGEEIREFSTIITLLVNRNERGRCKFVKADHSFFSDSQFSVKFLALSPSDVAVGQSIAALALLAPSEGAERLSISMPKGENHNAVAAHFSFGQFSILLGSDLEVTRNPNTGWDGVVYGGSYQNQSLGRSSFYKVAHHCSATAHHTEIWNQLLYPRPTVIATPFSRSKLPGEEDIARIKNFAGAVHVTRSSATLKSTLRDKVVEKEMKAVAKMVQPLTGEMGHIQIRADGNGVFRIATNGIPVQY